MSLTGCTPLKSSKQKRLVVVEEQNIDLKFVTLYDNLTHRIFSFDTSLFKHYLPFPRLETGSSVHRLSLLRDIADFNGSTAKRASSFPDCMIFVTGPLYEHDLVLYYHYPSRPHFVNFHLFTVQLFLIKIRKKCMRLSN